MCNIFDRNQYLTWRQRVISLLQSEKAHTCLELDSKIYEINEAEDEKARKIMTSLLDQESIILIQDCKSAREVWLLLEKEHLHGSEGRFLAKIDKIHELLTSFKMSDKCDVISTARDLLNLALRMKSAGADLDENDFIDIILNAMPTDYSPIVEFWMLLCKADRNINLLTHLIEALSRAAKHEARRMSGLIQEQRQPKIGIEFQQKDSSNCSNLVSAESSKKCQERISSSNKVLSNNTILTSDVDIGVRCQGSSNSSDMNDEKGSTDRPFRWSTCPPVIFDVSKDQPVTMTRYGFLLHNYLPYPSTRYLRDKSGTRVTIYGKGTIKDKFLGDLKAYLTPHNDNVVSFRDLHRRLKTETLSEALQRKLNRIYNAALRGTAKITLVPERVQGKDLVLN